MQCSGTFEDFPTFHDELNLLENGEPVLTGQGSFPLQGVRDALRQIGYDRFVSFKWGKQWHPEIADAKIALPHFTRWFREN
jgi:sugar phosphate isomerase/epimerase